MAKHSRALRIVRHSSIRPIVIRAPTPMKKFKKHHHRRGGSRGLMSKERMAVVVGGLAVGFMQKQKLPLPTLPMLGEAGTIGLAAYLLSDGGKHKLADEICTAALTVAAYEFGSTGTVVGQEAPGFDGVGYVAGY
jgi:hypothetical protein